MRRRTLTRSTIWLLPLLLIGWTPIPSSAQTRTVRMVDVAFKPKVMRVQAGDIVRWRNDGGINHTTTTRKTYPSSWDKNLQPGRTYSKRFSFAGSYGYFCRPHEGGMNGRIEVPTTATPRTGTNSTRFVIGIAYALPPDGWALQVQRRVNDGSWKLLKDRIAKRSFAYRSNVDGKHRFRTRLVKRNLSVKHLWSPVVGITIS